MATMSSSKRAGRGGYKLTREDVMDEISARVKILRRQESSTYKIPDYLSSNWQSKLIDLTLAAHPDSASARAQADDPDGTQTDRSVINELWREKICEWCYQVVDHFDFNREIVSIALNYLDRYLATRTVNRRIFQLAAMTALWLAIKLYEPGKLRMSQLIDLSRGYFMAEHVVTMEDSMLQSLKWHVHPPTPLTFCRDLMRLVSGEIRPRARHDVNELARFLSELSVCDYWFVSRKPSAVALAAVINSLELQGATKVDPRHKIEFLHRVVEVGMDIANDEEIIQCYERLREMYIAGGYTPTLEDGRADVVSAATKPEEEARIATVSPTGVADGPDAGVMAPVGPVDVPPDDDLDSEMSL